VDVKIRETIKDDLRAVFETHFDERVLSRQTGNHSMDAARAADPAPVHVGEVGGLRIGLADGDGPAHQHRAAIFHDRAPCSIAPLRSKGSKDRGATVIHITIKVRESMDLPAVDAIVAGLAVDDAAVADLVAALRASTEELRTIRVGARDRARAEAIAAAHGVAADVATDDPLAGAPGLGTQADHRLRIDKGGVIGALAGAAIGTALGFLPAGRFITMVPDQAPLIDGLLFFVAGGISGAVLGGAFGQQLSTHAGFRLIDGMDEGSIAVIVSCVHDRASAIRAIFDANRATDVVVIG
jgi:hypothetical protein